MQKKWQCKISNTLGGGFAGTPNEVWGTTDYKDLETPTVFFGCYGLPDLMAIRQHKGRKAILWAGTDVTYLINGFWLDDNGEFRVEPKVVGQYLNKTCENWCENDLERLELASVGIVAKVCPSYLGDVKKIKPCYKKSETPKAYISVSGDDFKAYGWDRLDEVARRLPMLTFYCYGNKTPYKFKEKNIVVRGRVSQAVMDKEIEDMQVGVRLNVHDGFSEILAKAILREQHVLSEIEYPFSRMDRKEARRWLLKNVNKYPWNTRS